MSLTDISGLFSHCHINMFEDHTQNLITLSPEDDLEEVGIIDIYCHLVYT